MKKWIIIILASATAGAITLFGLNRMIGVMVANEIASLETSLAATGRVQVRQLEYQRDSTGGVLDYELVLNLLPDDPLYPRLYGILGGTIDQGIPLVGRLPVEHGPWLGDGAGIGLARAQVELALPDELRLALPDFPTHHPLVKLTATMNLSRQIEVRLEGTDYRGPLLPPDESLEAALVLSGLGGRLLAEAGLDEFSWSIWFDEISLAFAGEESASGTLKDLILSGNMKRRSGGWANQMQGRMGEARLGSDLAMLQARDGHLHVDLGAQQSRASAERQSIKGEVALGSITIALSGHEHAELSLGQTSMAANLLREWPSVWTGTAELGIAAAKLTENGLVVELDTLSVLSDTRKHDGLVDQSLRLEIGPLQINGLVLGRGQMRVSASGLDGEALSDLLLQLESIAADDSLTIANADSHERIRPALLRILSGQPMIEIEPLAFGFKAPDDARAHLLLRYRGNGELQLTPPADWLERLEIDTSLSVTHEALQEFIRLDLEIAAKVAKARGKVVPSASEIERESTARFRNLILLAANLPFTQLQADHISTTARLQNGQLTINGEEADELLELLVPHELPLLF